ncbi:type IV pilus assembly protein PilM [Evansella caseinilytica]|uniref:Type IV pilus assembly protein PilM n=1 Tax=Evansella caseinilytica TaxID=1503961 RepID=A0A1H3PT64_9BACI|nr:pilus assembly protein PilM [Evansella caseinilytica]SDZ04143.1 type IV pilus assembly protein PilM [Evansella caseinilytica]
MFSFHSRKKSVNAIHIKDHVIRHVSTKGPATAAAKSFGEKYLPKGIVEKGKITDEAAFDRVMEECVENWRLKNKEVKLFVPDAAVFFRKLPVSHEIPAEEVRGFLNFEIGTNIHLPFEEVCFDYYFLPNVAGEQREILFFAAPEPLMKKHRKKMEQFKLKPVAADVAPLSLYRLYSLLGAADEREHYLFIEWDVTSVNLSIFHRHLPVFIRHLPHGMEGNDWVTDSSTEVTELVCQNKEKIEMEIIDQLSEIERVMNFYKYSLHQGEQAITSIVLAGDHPLLSAIKKRLEQYDVAVITLDEEKIGIHGTIPGFHSRYLVPLSLCLKEV